MSNDLEFDEVCCEAKLPESMTISPSGCLATCWACGYRSGLWECACELVHDCVEDES
jgi:hypothetical protein